MNTHKKNRWLKGTSDKSIHSQPLPSNPKAETRFIGFGGDNACHTAPGRTEEMFNIG